MNTDLAVDHKHGRVQWADPHLCNRYYMEARASSGVSWHPCSICTYTYTT